jgi:hypothetical protein
MGQWALTVLACPLAGIIVALAVYFLHPADATSLPHDLGARALSFSLHLLVVTILALGLGLLARRLRARLAAGVFGLVALLSLFLALWPSIVGSWRGKRTCPCRSARTWPTLHIVISAVRNSIGRSYMAWRLTARS